MLKERKKQKSMIGLLYNLQSSIHSRCNLIWVSNTFFFVGIK